MTAPLHEPVGSDGEAIVQDRSLRSRLLIPVLGIAFATTMVLAPLLWFGKYPATHESLRYAYLSMHFSDAISSGVFYPRWMPDLAGGYGCPTFVFYQPLFFYVASACSWLVDGNAVVPLCAAAVFLLLGGTGAYKVGRHFGSQQFAVLIAILFLLTPYVFVNLYVRGDLSELAAMMITPWPIHYLLGLIDGLNRDRVSVLQATGLAISLAAIVYAHPAAALLYWPTFFAIAGIGLIGRTDLRIRFIKVLAVVTVCSLALCCPYWFPVLSLKATVHLDRATADYYQAATHTVHPLQWFRFGWGFGGSAPDSRRDGMSFQLGLPHCLLALWGLWLGRRNKQSLYIGLVYAALLVFMTGLTRPFWQSVELVELVQFPWRLLSCVAIVQVLCITGLASRLDRTQLSEWNRILPICIVVACIGSYWEVFSMREDSYSLDSVQSTTETEFESIRNKFETYSEVDEFLPRSASLEGLAPLGDRPLLTASDHHVEIADVSGHNRHNLAFEVAHHEPCNVVLNQLYFPGWYVQCNGVMIPDHQLRENALADGRLMIQIAGSGTTSLTACYQGPPGIRVCYLVALVIPTLALIAGIYLPQSNIGASQRQDESAPC